MIADRPTVSIGLPVFNGENYISDALDSLLVQTFEDLEIVISDNASSDNTGEICRAYAEKDPRIRYFHSAVNLGAAPNFNRVFELSTGKYFKWASHDDLCAPRFLEVCINELEKDDSLVLCYPRTSIIDEEGKPYLDYIVKVDTTSTKRHERFRNMIGIEHWCYQIFGVIRADKLKTTQLIGPYSDSDRVLLAELSLIGRILEVEEHLFFRREHDDTSTRAYPGEVERMLWFDSQNAARNNSWYFMKFRGYARSVNKVPMTRRERLLCYMQLGRTAGEKIFTRLSRKLKSQADRSHIAVPVEGVEWN
jgi:glycosyltransferase involved in cell wall biosynthesis